MHELLAATMTDWHELFEETKYHDCKDKDGEVFLFHASNGALIYKKYCKVCGGKMEGPIAHKKIAKECRVEYIMHRDDPQCGINVAKNLWKENARRNWWAVYSRYLDSEQWHSIRENRLKLDANKCQICYLAAEVVHHLDYYTVGNESMESLVSLCHKCHVGIHARKDAME